MNDERRICPKCRTEAEVFANTSRGGRGYIACECLSCRIAWRRWDDTGEWERIYDQDPDTLEVATDGSLVVWDEE